MDNLSEDIVKYKKGELSPKEMHALEKKALNDPFLAEALEGSDLISGEDFSVDVSELNKKISERRKIIWFTPLRIAAGIMLVAGSVFLVYQLAPKRETLALKRETNQSPNQKSDSARTREQKPIEGEEKINRAAAKAKQVEKPKKETIQQIASGRASIKPEVKKIEEIKPAIESIAQNDVLAESEIVETKPRAEVAKEKIENVQLKEVEKIMAAPIIAQQPVKDLAFKEPRADKKRAAHKISSSAEGAGFARIREVKSISGIVVSSEDNSVIPGVNIVVKGTSTGTVTDASGSFTIATNDSNSVLIFSFVGYQSKEVDFQRQNSLVIKLESSNIQLNEVVVTAAGIARESKALGYSVARLKNSVSGIVSSSEDNFPLPGVNVVIKGTSIGTVTDDKGNFTISTDESNTVLVFSFIGYQSKEVDPQGQNSLVIKLESDYIQLSEVFVTASGFEKPDNSKPIIHLAEPVGGKKAYEKYLESKVHYPEEALAKKIKGKVRVEFELHADGSFDQYKVVKSLGYGCDEEVIRLIKEGPKWSPTTFNGKAIESKVRVGLRFDPAKAGR